MVKSSWVLLGIGLFVAAGLPLLGNWVRRHQEPRCALDGVEVEALFRVRVEDEVGDSHEFCCAACAELWLNRHGGKPHGIYVTDEVTGQEVDATEAYFVRSTVATPVAGGSGVHVFLRRTDAERHAQAFHGTLLNNTERPFPAAQ